MIMFEELKIVIDWGRGKLVSKIQNEIEHKSLPIL